MVEKYLGERALLNYIEAAVETRPFPWHINIKSESGNKKVSLMDAEGTTVVEEFSDQCHAQAYLNYANALVDSVAVECHR
ncbi:MAG: hypothetical protein A2W52_03815 [Candidatus Taylorbacteria bacterium RIFCSPHIGHO2_02_49_25]|uniref:Uncharacterized protein n=1 Tax=Candidatus Taylorbacteria bacterium RIFCSPHIGHO2_02_49_25 TaxID=1802305 RepID=A0A1G2MFA2_9BACT|nr:MAG: hypothetical protein UY62_C0039G0024 [Parcubacteria group bacterium GW2011_GWF2_50_9]OHA20912.1 MAG: hypothetical protein A2759_01690 [Candidatus Taylorbacteria bacterium RIFCSPHIGHO2_01_FULL_49_60]OHA22547.1 MAG: hypothetical protein A2W52_03815 [Candidatus Taylorbacteria bacterium RIFCSPHIGHO2_02_49_25]OHA36743.1 MAG: hypothetical protein A2W65_01945 [Candidatus Taylorbacteria bacterium RIFCSPLOWO2_02_50_13]OHA42529.1 MAG: hypothetical protein A3H73_04040 [Candidatus Taylorbacteria ba